MPHHDVVGVRVRQEPDGIERDRLARLVEQDEAPRRGVKARAQIMMAPKARPFVARTLDDREPKGGCPWGDLLAKPLSSGVRIQSGCNQSVTSS